MNLSLLIAMLSTFNAGRVAGYCSLITEANQGYCEEITIDTKSDDKIYLVGYDAGRKEATDLINQEE